MVTIVCVAIRCDFTGQIKQVDIVKKNCSTLAGVSRACLKDGDFSEAGFSEPGGLWLLVNQLYIADTNNHCIRVMDLNNKTVSQVVNVLRLQMT